MVTKLNYSQFLKKAFLMPIAIGAFFLFSCESVAQTKKEHEKKHVENKGHDRDGKGHGEEREGHDNDAKHKEGKMHDHDGKNHGTEYKGHDNDDKEFKHGEHKREKGEEDGTTLKSNQIYDVTKHGVRLVLKYNKKLNVFEGYIENMTNKAIERARVEVHLSNGTELGPTTPITLAARTKKNISLKGTKERFSTWSTHAEIGNMEHGEGNEGHDRKERKERHGDNERGEHG